MEKIKFRWAWLGSAMFIAIIFSIMCLGILAFREKAQTLPWLWKVLTSSPAVLRLGEWMISILRNYFTKVFLYGIMPISIFLGFFLGIVIVVVFE